MSNEESERITTSQDVISRLHDKIDEQEARIAELEAELEAVGAGGVQRLAAAPQGVPVAWRYQTPTGWHATTDADSAIRVNAHHTIEPLYTHPTQQGMDAIAALQKVRDIAVSALLTGSIDRQDWIDDMDRIAAQAKQGGQANG